MNASDEMDPCAWKISGSKPQHASKDATLFSSSLPVLAHQTPNLMDANKGCQTVDEVSASLKKMHSPNWEGDDAFEFDEYHAIGSLLPDDEDELLAGIIDNLGIGGLPHHVDDVEEFDIFGSGGGLEMESDSLESLSLGTSTAGLSDVAGNGMAHFGLTNGVGTVVGEHPLGEHPSRTLFVRNINSTVEDAQLRSLFEPYGDIRSMYTACKHRGFVMISYYDIRAARNAKRLLQNKPLGKRKLDIHFSIPKDNPSDKDLNQGTLVVFNLDPSVSNDDLRQIFGAYGEVKEIRETPFKRHHKFIEYYDIRAAEDALRSLNRCDIAGKRIKLEPSRPGGARRNHMLHRSQDYEQDELRSFLHQVGSSIGNSPAGNWTRLGSPLEHSPLQSLSKSPQFSSPTLSNNLSGLASILDPQPSNSPRVAPVGNDYVRNSQMNQIFTNGIPNHGDAFLQALSFPECNSSLYSGTASSFDASSSNGSVFETLSEPQLIWRSPKQCSELSNFATSRGRFIGHHVTSNGQIHISNHGPFFNSYHGHHQHGHHAGSAPSGFPFQRNFSYHHDPPGTSMKPSFDGIGYFHNEKKSLMNLSGCGSVSISGNMSESGSPGFGTMSSPGNSHSVLGNYHFPGFEGFTECGCVGHVETIGNQMDRSKQFQLDLHKIGSGEDTRTTLMIKNIPNKYTSKMLLAAINENHLGTYDFFYLPIDFKNKCNVGYAFINMLSPMHIIPFYKAFNGKRWEKFNSEKVASLAYARIQGKPALVSHFQKSGLMNEDKRCRPFLLHSGSSESPNLEYLPSDHFNT